MDRPDARLPSDFNTSTQLSVLLPSTAEIRVSTEISIIVPVYNEQENVLPLTREVIGAMKGSPRTYELVFVDDCSTDASLDIALRYAGKDCRVRVEHNPTAVVQPEVGPGR